MFFEVDGPYQNMIIPAEDSREEGKLLKKRCDMLNNNDGSLAAWSKGIQVEAKRWIGACITILKLVLWKISEW